MTPADSTRLSALIATERTTRAQATPADNEASAPIEASRRLLVPTQGGQDCAPAAQPNMSIISDGHRLLPTSGRNPIVASKLGHSQVAAGDNVTPLRREMGRPTRQDRRTVSRANARSGKRGGAEARVRAVIANDPAAGFDDIVRRAKVSASSASKWLAVVQAEQTAQRQAAQRGTPNGY